MNQLVRERVSHSLTRFTLQCNIQVEVFRLTTSCMELALTFELFLQHPTPIGRPLFDLRFCSYHLLSPDYKIYITQLSYKLKEYPTSSELCAQLTCTKGSSACFPYDINLQSAKEKNVLYSSAEITYNIYHGVYHTVAGDDSHHFHQN